MFLLAESTDYCCGEGVRAELLLVVKVEPWEGMGVGLRGQKKRDAVSGPGGPWLT